MKNYRLSNKAIQDLEDIWIFTLETWSQKQADRYYNLIISEIEYLASNPSSSKDISFVKTGYLSAKVKSHIIFYKKFDTDSIEVIRILHERMDLENRLK